jgi:signal transduction histidine kinase
MANQNLQECINECESALTHLNNAMNKMDNQQSRQRLEHASKDLQECISECRSAL